MARVNEVDGEQTRVATLSKKQANELKRQLDGLLTELQLTAADMRLAIRRKEYAGLGDPGRCPG